MTEETRVLRPVRARRVAFSLFAWARRVVAEENRALGGGLEASTTSPMMVLLE